jgi:predicted nucleic acid-binding protein
LTVVDASVFVDALVTMGTIGDAARAELRGRTELPAPAIFRAEATSALRDLVLRNELDEARARDARARIRYTRIVTYPFEPFADRVWELRENLTVYDAWYVARSPGPRCPIHAPGEAS